MPAEPQPDPPTRDRTDKFEMVQPMLEAAHKEMGELSKKKQDGVLNPLKVRYINRLLLKAQEALAEDPSREFVELLDEDPLPQNSDAVFVLGQWLAAMTQFRGRHFGFDPVGPAIRPRWFTVENPHPYARPDDEPYTDDQDGDDS